jgi:predicted dehydrogenase
MAPVPPVDSVTGVEPRVVIIGAGFITRIGHLRGYKAANANVVALCDLLPERAQALADQYGVPKVYTDWREMLAAERPDVVSVCLPNVQHLEVTITALDQGAHVVCEKPLATSVDEAKQMFVAAQRNGRLLLTAQNFRFYPATRLIKSVVDAGELGEVYFGEATAMRRLGIPTWGVFHQKAHSFGGSLLDIGVHRLDQTLWLMGNPRPLRVSATIETRWGTRPEIAALRGNNWEPARFDVDDFATAFVRLEGGKTLLLRSSWAAHVEAPQVMASRLIGTEGGAQTAPPSVFRLRHGNFVNESYANLPDQNSYDEEFKHFMAVFRGQAQPIVTEAQTLDVQRVLNAAYHSAEVGEEVAVEA